MSDDNLEKDLYIAQLKPREVAALEIAQRMLGTSFDLFKSKGFLQWKQKQIKPK